MVETRFLRPPQGSAAAPQTIYLPDAKSKTASNVAFEAPLTIEVVDRDAAKTSRSQVVVQLETTSGAKIDVRCVVAPDPASGIYLTPDQIVAALEEGRFIGQVVLQLGSKDSPDVVPITASMPRALLGGGIISEEESSASGETLVTRVLNLSGKDLITATYSDALRPKGKPVDLKAQARLIANGTLACTDRDYERPVTQLHVGEKLFLIVHDADLDISDERDKATVEITGERGEHEVFSLEETLSHSGVFSGSILLEPNEKPTPDNLDPADPVIETYFGDSLRVRYADENASTESGTLAVEIEIPVVVGTDGVVAAFSKVFDDEALAVETQFHIAESCFELFKSHKNLGRKDEQRADLEAGRRVLREVMEDYPNPKYVPRIAYLLGQFSQELGNWDEAITSYQMIVRQFPDSSLAADAQYKLAQCYEESDDFENAARGLRDAGRHVSQEPADRQRDGADQRPLLQERELRSLGPGGREVPRTFRRTRMGGADGLPYRPVLLQGQAVRQGLDRVRQICQGLPRRCPVCRCHVLVGRKLPHGQQHQRGLPQLQSLPLETPGQRSGQVRPRPPGPARDAAAVRSRSHDRRMRIARRSWRA